VTNKEKSEGQSGIDTCSIGDRAQNEDKQSNQHKTEN